MLILHASGFIVERGERKPEEARGSKRKQEEARGERKQEEARGSKRKPKLSLKPKILLLPLASSLSSRSS